MLTFNMKTRRTRRYNSLGRRIYTTLNKTSRQPTYSNTEPRFVMTCQSRSNSGGKGCTNAGCGDQCCLLSFLVSDISFNDWMSDISGIGVGQTLVNASDSATIGTIKEIVFPCACCQVIGLIGNDEYNNFPLDMRILAKPASGSCANSRYTGGNLSTTQAGDISGNPTIEEKYEVLGTSNVGAPYRNPIKGWRKTLDCCLCENYQLTGNFSQTPNTNTLIGSTIASAGGDGFSGIIEGYSYIPGTSFGYSLTIQTTNCPPKNIPSGVATVSTESYSNNFTITATNGLSGRTRLIADDIYQDNYSGPKSAGSGCCPGGGQARSGIQGRTHRPIIRSGMQPKPNICCSTGKFATKCNRDPNGCIEKNNYAYDYYQYLHNKRCKSFERSQEKFFPIVNGVQATLGSCAQGTCQRSVYRKSGCCECCVSLVQVLEWTVPTTPPLVAEPDIGSTITQGDTIGVGPTGIVLGVSTSGPTMTISVQLHCTAKRFLSSGTAGLGYTGTAGGVPINWSSIPTSTNSESGRRLGLGPITTYKPNNRKFSKQGAVTSSGRLERLKLDTIRTSNSKCPKGQRCRTIVGRNGTSTQTFLAPKGPYFSGKPRFTGWMYNARHPERICMLKYRQQPFGIPQLTNRQRATRSNRLVNVDPKARGVVGVWQRGNTNPRAPGCKCLAEGSPGCPHANCHAACGTGQMAVNPGVPCCN